MHREDDRPETIRKRLQVYRDETEPLIRFYGRRPGALTVVDGGLSAEAVQKNIREVVCDDGAER